MTPAELRDAAKALGLTGRGLALVLGVDERTHRRWLAGDLSVPRSVQIAVQAMLAGYQPR